MVAPAVAFLVSLIVTLLLVKYEHLHAHVTADHDLDGVQKYHATPVPRIGGIGIMLGLIISEIMKLFMGVGAAGFGFLVIVAAIPAFAIGLLEDLTKRVSVRRRLLVTACSAVVGGFLLNGWITRVDVPWIDYLIGFSAISMVVTCVSVAGVANAFNLIDGYNGLSAMVAVIIMCGLAYVASQVGDRIIMIFALTVVGANLGFLLWNYPKGLVFLGDGGAYLIGFLVAELSILLVARNADVSPWFPLLLSFYPIFETIFTIFRRVAIGKTHPGMPDAAHLHQLIYRRVVRLSLVGGGAKRRTQRNSLTSPYLWLICVASVFPSVLFWNNTTILLVLLPIESFVYIFIYMAIYKRKIPKFFVISIEK